MNFLKNIKSSLKRLIKINPRIKNTSTQPLSRTFGLDRGTPIDRYYIENFLEAHSNLIKGEVLEIGGSDYSKRYGKNVSRYNVLHATHDNPEATIVGDLSDPNTLPKEVADCFIATQTFQFIYDLKLAVQGAHRLLKKDGVLLATVPGISQISRYDMDRWGDYWRFTTLSTLRVFEETFGKGNVEVKSYGNCLTSCAFLKGVAREELEKQQLDENDQDYQMLITIVAQKK